MDCLILPKLWLEIRSMIFGPKNLFSTHLRYLYKLINNLKKPFTNPNKLETERLFKLIYIFLDNTKVKNYLSGILFTQ
jgi:hypothetical protein